MTCASLEDVVRFALDELPEQEAAEFEQHYFACDACLSKLDRIQRLLDDMRSSLPLVLTPERRQRLGMERPNLRVTHVSPDETATLQLGPEHGVGLWVMHAPLSTASRVDLDARLEDGTPLMSMKNVPFDASRGEVALPCQIHFRDMGGTSGGSRMVVELTASSAAEQSVTKYFLDHLFESS